MQEYQINFDGENLMFISPKNTNRKLCDELCEVLNGLASEKDENIINLLVKVLFFENLFIEVFLFKRQLIAF